MRRVWSQYGEGWTKWGIEGFNPTWRIQRDYGGGMVYDYAPHCGDRFGSSVINADARGIVFSDEWMTIFYADAVLRQRIWRRMTILPGWYVVGTKGCITAQGGTVQTVLLWRRFTNGSALWIAACRGKAKPNVTPDQLRAVRWVLSSRLRVCLEGQSRVLCERAYLGSDCAAGLW